MRNFLIVCLFLLGGTGFAFAATIEPATPNDRPAVVYPSAAGTAEGNVKLRYTIGADGHVKELSIVESNPKGVFEDAALAALSHWTYHPRLSDGVPVDQPNNIVVLRFQPDDFDPSKPILIHSSAPYYPRLAFDAKIEGSVTVRADSLKLES